MNSESEIIQFQPQPAAPVNQPPDPASPDPTPLANDHPSTAYVHRGNGRVARLPKPIRDQVNNLLLDGLSYPAIIAQLGDSANGLNPGHLCEWKKRGYQDWLQRREWLERLDAKSDFSIDVLAAPDSASMHEAGLRIAAAQMFDQLAHFAGPAFASSPEPEKFARLVNALSRLTREALSFQKYHDASDRERLLQLKQLPADRDLTHNDHDMFLKKVEEFFRIKFPRPAPGSPPPFTDDSVEADSP